jgi:multisubunit Na+/H+ antiporter MnhB subunit
MHRIITIGSKQTMRPLNASRRERFGLTQTLLLIMILTFVCTLFRAVWSLPFSSPGLREQVFSELEHSGVRNPVTAVLLNFRGYDTLLEIAVLLAAVVGAWSLGNARSGYAGPPPGPVLMGLIRLLTPLMVLVAGYLLWAGAHAPGGAFQGGAVMGAAGVLLLLTDVRISWRHREWPLRLGLVLGLSVFLAVAVESILVSGRLLEYPRDAAGGLIMLVESAATVSIGITLAALFAGGRPRETKSALPEQPEEELQKGEMRP